MNCEDVQSHLLDLRRRRLEGALRREVRAHLERCTACARVDRAERAVDEVLERRLPRHAAPTALRRRLGVLVEGPAPAAAQPARMRWTRVLAPAMAAALALVGGWALVQRNARQEAAVATLTGEVVNDYLRVLASPHPPDIASGGQHQVKPWFEGKLDFAPEVPALENTELQLRGGSVGYVFDRKAAVLVYGLRRHVVTLLVFRLDGLAWPGSAEPGHVHATSSRGFNVVLWRAGELGYALVSDANAKELGDLAVRLAAATTPSAR